MIYSVNEGQQAEEYKARKAKEAEDRFEKDYEHRDRRLHHGYQTAKTGRSDADKARDDKTKKIIDKEFASRMAKAEHADKQDNRSRTYNPDLRNKARVANKNLTNLGFNSDTARDAANRHIRRHPKQYKEGTIFESVEFI